MTRLHAVRLENLSGCSGLNGSVGSHLEERERGNFYGVANSDT
jgi:hypothetical protein